MTRCANPGGRPKKHASAAERQRAYRERWGTVNARVEARTAEVLRNIAAHGDWSIGDVVNAALKFYATNYTWQAGDLFGKRLPTVNDPRTRAEMERDRANRDFLQGADDGENE